MSLYKSNLFSHFFNKYFKFDISTRTLHNATIKIVLIWLYIYKLYKCTVKSSHELYSHTGISTRSLQNKTMELYPRNCNLRSNYITSNLRLKPLALPSTSIKLAAFVLLKIDS